MNVNPVIDNLNRHLQSLVGERHPLTSPTALLRTEQYLTEQFLQLGWLVTRQDFDWQGIRCNNIIAELPDLGINKESHPGADERSSPLIVGAHYDTVQGSPGADDNASGLAVLLEVARCLPERNVQSPVRLIAFCMEEEDLAGSLAYAKILQEQGEAIQGALILECVGYASSQDLSQQSPPDLPIALSSVGNFLGIVGNQASVALINTFESAAQRAVPELKTVSLAVPGQGELFPDTRRSDHASFWHYGFPALMLTDTADFRNPNYHTSTDTLDTLDVHFMGQVAKAVVAAVVALGGKS